MPIAVRQARRFGAAAGTRPGRYAARAFTLIEVAIALALLVALAVMAWPALKERMTASELPDSADRVRSLMFMTRSAAVMEHHRHRIRFAPDDQQPIVEFEVDPVKQPGEWAPVKADWADQDFMLGDIQVYSIQLGRPIWTLPLAADASAGEVDERLGEDVADPEKADESAADEDDYIPRVMMGDAEIDEYRLPIVFEVDGSSDWATMILARKKTGEELKDEDAQLWVVIDGRTGIAKVQEKYTTEQLSDPDFYVAREKLQLPDQVNTDDLTLTSTTASDDSMAMSGGGASQMQGLPTGGTGAIMSGDGGQKGATINDLKDAIGAAMGGQSGGKGMPQLPGGLGAAAGAMGGKDGRPTGGGRPGGGMGAGPADGSGSQGFRRGGQRPGAKPGDDSNGFQRRPPNNPQQDGDGPTRRPGQDTPQDSKNPKDKPESQGPRTEASNGDQSKLDQAMSDSNLTDEEKERIRQAMEADEQKKAP